MASLILAVSMVVFALAVLVWPVLRQLRRIGKTGVTRGSGPLDRVIMVGGATLILGVLGFVVAHATAGPAAVGALSPPLVALGVGVALLIVAIALVVVAQAQMGASWRIGIDEEQTELVQSGLFGHVRNPIYTGVLVLLVGVLVIAPSAWTVAALGLAWLLVALQARLEEAHLAAQHGAAFARYAARVGRFLPGIGRLQAHDA